MGFCPSLWGSHFLGDPTAPLAKEINPQLAFDRLFRSQAARASGRLGQDQSVLDLVADDARRLQNQLRSTDRQKLGEYLDSVRAVERRIAFDRRRKQAENFEDPQVRAEIARLGRAVTCIPIRPGLVSVTTTIPSRCV